MMNEAIYGQLAEGVKKSINDDLLCTMISGAGGIFSGGDLKWFLERSRVHDPNALYFDTNDCRESTPIEDSAMH